MTKLRDDRIPTVIGRLIEKHVHVTVMIRAMYELLIHGAEERLREIGGDPEVAARLRNAKVPANSPDTQYLRELMGFFKEQIA